MKKNTILFFVLLIAASLLLFIHTFSVLAHTPERTGGEGLWVNFLMNLPCCILIGYADYRVAKSLQKRFPDRNVIRIASSILLTALPVGLFAVAINYAIARLYAHPFSIAGSVFPIMLWNSLIVLFIELFFYNRRQIEQQRRLALMEKEKALYHFETLKNQINPIFCSTASMSWHRSLTKMRKRPTVSPRNSPEFTVICLRHTTGHRSRSPKSWLSSNPISIWSVFVSEMLCESKSPTARGGTIGRSFQPACRC